MTTEGQRLREHLKLVGEAKAQSHAEMAAAHLALPLEERLRRAIAFCEEMRRLIPPKNLEQPDAEGLDSEARAWRRVNERLRRGR